MAALSGVGKPAYDGGLIDNTFSYIDNLTWQHGKHTVSFGVQALRYQNNYPTSNNNGYLGSMFYTGAFTSNPSLANAGGYRRADFVLDRVSSAAATLSSVNVGQRQWRAAGFVSDDLQVMPNLTLNVGIATSSIEPWIEQNNKTGNIDLVTGQVIYAGHVPAGAPVGSGVCGNRACYDDNFRQMYAQTGFRLSANDRLVVRGATAQPASLKATRRTNDLTSITPFIQAVNVTTVAPTAAQSWCPAHRRAGLYRRHSQLWRNL